MSNDIQLPDFDDMFALVRLIADLTKQKITVDNEIKFLEAKAIEVAMNVDGKTPPISLVIATTKVTAVPMELKNHYADVVGQLEEAKGTLDIYHAMISLYQTDSANKRAALLP